ncbi:MAG TPA: class I SAM-dependent methyltransferase [Burkholderiaceae bacterium]|nr:class I SAM-dependent methyltransferase [Burkholderiaceae bacterium]
MSFSNEWEESYTKGKHHSIWPWSDLVSFVYKYCDCVTQRRGRVLELGCGAGANIPLFLHLAADYYAVEGSSSIVEELRGRYSQLVDRIAVADFTKFQPHGGDFDVVVDRASLTHNHTDGIRSALGVAWRALKPGGLFLGVDWFSMNHTEFAKGEQDVDSYTRCGFSVGQFSQVGRVHFSNESHIRELFSDWELLLLEETQVHRIEPGDAHVFASWKLVARKP